MIAVAKLRAIIENPAYSSVYDAFGDIAVELPPDGVILSGEEVAQIQEALRVTDCGVENCEICDPKLAALSLLDSTEET